jgi:hypothetical protein
VGKRMNEGERNREEGTLKGLEAGSWKSRRQRVRVALADVQESKGTRLGEKKSAERVQKEIRRFRRPGHKKSVTTISRVSGPNVHFGCLYFGR